MPVAILTACLSVLAFTNYRLYRSVMYPPFLFCGMWLLVFVLYSTQIIETNPLHVEVLWLVGLGASLFSIGGGIAMLLPSPIIETRLLLWPGSRKPSRDHFMRYVYFGIMLVAMSLTVYGTVMTGLASGGAGSILARARSANVDAANTGAVSGPSILSYLPAWTIYTAVLFAVERRNRLFWITAAVAFVTAVFTTGRGPILGLFSGLITVFLVQTNRTRFLQALKLVRVPILIFFGLYIGLIFTNKDTSTLEGGVAGIAVYFVVSYIVGPVAALDYVIEHPLLYNTEQNHTFKFPLMLASRLHLLQYNTDVALDSFVAVPFPTNVYTGYKFFYTDFGLIGTLIAAGIIGFLHTLLYRKGGQRRADGSSRSELGLYCFACSVVAVIMFIFDDLYSALGLNLTIVLFGSVYFTARHFTPLGSGRSAIPQNQVSTLA
jgi:oligosaccharide repeat unit polymerase